MVSKGLSPFDPRLTRPKICRFAIELWKNFREKTDLDGFYPAVVWWQEEDEPLQHFVRPPYMERPHPFVPEMTCNQACDAILARIRPSRLTSPYVHCYLQGLRTEERKFMGIFERRMVGPAPVPLFESVVIELFARYEYDLRLLDTSCSMLKQQSYDPKLWERSGNPEWDDEYEDHERRGGLNEVLFGRPRRRRY